jgi:hypothetical protein
MIEQDAVADEETVGLPIIDGIPVGGQFANRIRTAWIKRR